MLRKRGNLLYNIHPPWLPASSVRFTYTWGLGGVCIWLCVILGATGVLEMLYYVPTPAEANASVKAIAYLACYGWLVRNVHYWAAQGMLVAAFLHLCRVYLTGAAMSPRRFNWLLGLVLLGFTLLLDFSGWVLRWDQASQWALLVGTNLVREVPLAGETLYRWLVGGQAIGAPTLLRFYGWHAVGLPLLASGILLWHLWRIRRDGGISRAGAASPIGRQDRQRSGESPAPVPGEERHGNHVGQSQSLPPAGRVSRDVLVFREFAAAVVVLCALVLLAAAVGVEIGPAADPSALAVEVRAPWFFLGVQGLLRYTPPLLAGIIVPLAWMGALAVLPYLETGQAGTGVWFVAQRRPWLIAFGIIAGGMVGLLLWGWWVT